MYIGNREGRAGAAPCAVGILMDKGCLLRIPLRGGLVAAKYFVMRDTLAAARAVQQKDRAGEHWAFIAKKYQAIAKEHETLAAIHKMMAEQRK
jgi:hypothetical protein